MNINVTFVNATDIGMIRDRCIAKFSRPIKTGPIWEHLIGVSIYNVAGWSRISSWRPERKPVMFFDRSELLTGFEFSSTADVAAILGESFGFEFYLTDFEASYVIALNHHDVLIGSGDAVDWIIRQKKTL